MLEVKIKIKEMKEIMNIWHDINQERIKPDEFISVIEITKGGKNKYELDKETGMLRLDRVLYTATHYPANYGFIPRTYADDNMARGHGNPIPDLTASWPFSCQHVSILPPLSRDALLRSGLPSIAPLLTF